MFDDYYDTALYEKNNGPDNTGAYNYLSPVYIKVRAFGGKVLTVNNDDKNVKVTNHYHTKESIELGDKLDGHIVINVEKVKDVFGHYIYTIVDTL